MNKLPWFRVHHRIIHDTKLKLLAFEDRWHFVALMSLKASGELDEPDFSLRCRMAAMALGLSGSEFDEVVRRLQAVKLIDTDLCPVKWGELQSQADSSAKRTKAYRERKKAEQKQSSVNVKRHSDVTVTLEKEKEKEKEKDISPNGDCASSDALAPSHIFDEWNLVAEAIGRPKVRDRSPSRIQLVKARIAQYELSDFVSVFGKVRASDFLSGKTDRWQGVTFDWVMKRANFVKILEGNYDG